MPNVVAVNAALNVLGRAGAWREAVDLLDDMVIDRGYCSLPYHMHLGLFCFSACPSRVSYDFILRGRYSVHELIFIPLCNYPSY